MTFEISASVAPPLEIIRKVRKAVDAIREPVRDALKGPIRDEVLSLVRTTVATYPGPAVRPFQFANENSRAYYLMAKRKGWFPGQTYNRDDGQWDRTGTLYESWDVETNFGQNDGFVLITNNAQNERTDNYVGSVYAQAVLGPDAVPGHVNTGWAEEFDTQVSEIADLVRDELLNVFDEAFAEFSS